MSNNIIIENAKAVYQKTLMYWANSASCIDYDKLATGEHIAQAITLDELADQLPSPTQAIRETWLQSAATATGSIDVTAKPVAMLVALSDANSCLGQQAVMGIPLAHDAHMQAFVPVSSGQAPLINPRFLSRTEDQPNEYRVHVCDEEAYQDYIERNDVGCATNWPEYWCYVKRMTEALTGIEDPIDALIHTLGVRFQWAVVPWTVDFQGQSLSRQYKRLTNADTAPPLFRRVATSHEPVAALFDDHLAMRGFEKILGHMDTYNAQEHRRESFSLDESQRRAVSALTQMETGELLAVNGPPGTGKTSFLRSVVATAWVQAALEGQHAPIIVATSSTNKAVTNVIEAFGSVAGPHDQAAWQSRWISNAPSYGWYYPAKSKKADASTGRFMLLIDNGVVNEEGEHFSLDGAASGLRLKDQALDQAIQDYLQRHAAVCGLSEPLKRLSDARAHIRALLMDSVARMRAIQSRNRSYGNDVNDVEAQLDRTYRFRHFHMASRYWEARWLDHCLAQQKGCSIDRDEELRALAMIAPVFVSTTHKVESLLSYHGHADLLIFDEAGQTSVEAGAAMFAFAKKAIVVGDVHQLKPVYKVNPARSRDLKRQAKLDKLPLHLDVAKSSVMAMAQMATRWTDFAFGSGQPLGIHLRNHYRCRPAIIGYCQSLIYKDALHARRPDPAQPLLPAMSWVPVADHTGSIQEAGTRFNMDEVDEVCRWLELEGERLMRHYGKNSLAEVVAVIAPFRGQVNQLQAAIHGRLPASWTEGMIINTVHALQGAEMPVVVFAMTQTEAPFFVDRHGPNLLNVAVSRAKDSFIAFGSAALWQTLFAESTQDLPMQSLANYMKQHGQRLYPRDVYLIEAPGKVDVMQKAIGLSAHVIASGGHYKKLEVTETGLAFRDIDSGVKAALQSVLDDQDQIDHIFISTDDDDDGEEIAWHLMNDLQNLGPSLAEKIKRIRFHAVTAQALKDAVEAAEANVSVERVRVNVAKKVLDHTLHQTMRAGHVQATRPQWLLMQEMSRRQEVLPKWSLQWQGDILGRPVSGVVKNANGDVLRLPTKERLDATVLRLSTHAEQSICINRFAMRPRQGKPTTTALVLAHAYQRYRWMPHHTMDKLKVLYQGRRRLRAVGASAPGRIHALPHGGVITYPRTEGVTPLQPVGIAVAAPNIPPNPIVNAGVA